jgi:serine/threonine protein phosphatase PrpC
VKTAIIDIIARTEAELLANKHINTDFSGTTMTLAVITGHHITLANVGDSRITLAVRDKISPERLVAVPLTRDHKPDIPEEQARILATGGRVYAVEYEDGVKGPPRVWLPTVNTPGLAMSRSLCDRVGHVAGVSSEPEFFERTLDPTDDCMLIVASDGLWEFVSDQDAVDIAAQAAEPADAVNALIHEGCKRWMKSENSIDDTSVCVAFLSGLKSRPTPQTLAQTQSQPHLATVSLDDATVGVVSTL